MESVVRETTRHIESSNGRDLEAATVAFHVDNPAGMLAQRH